MAQLGFFLPPYLRKCEAIANLLYWTYLLRVYTLVVILEVLVVPQKLVAAN